MTDDIGVILARVASLESATTKLAGMIDPDLGTRVSKLEGTADTILNSHLPAIRDDLASVKAVAGALQSVPGVVDFEERLKEKIAEWFGTRIDALENWASNLGQASHNAFNKPATPTPAADPAKPAA